MTTTSNFIATLATPASLVGSLVRTALVLMAASFVVWDDRWAFTIPSRITLRLWRLGSAGRSIFEPRLGVVRPRQPVKGEETSTVVGPVHCILASRVTGNWPTAGNLGQFDSSSRVLSYRRWTPQPPRRRLVRRGT